MRAINPDLGVMLREPKSAIMELVGDSGRVSKRIAIASLDLKDDIVESIAAVREPADSTQSARLLGDHWKGRPASTGD